MIQFEKPKHVTSRDPRKRAIQNALRAVYGLPAGKGRVTLVEENAVAFGGNVHLPAGHPLARYAYGDRVYTIVPKDEVPGQGRIK